MTAGLPRYRTAFVGRDAELARVVRLVGPRGGVVSLVGPGGIGKTRLAVEAAARVAGAVFVDATGVSDDDGAYAAFLAALGTTAIGPGSALEQAVAALVAAAPELVVIDNAEHVLPQVRAVVCALRDARPEATVLVTTRVALGLDWERVVPLQPLAPPSAGVLLADEPAVQVLLHGLSPMAPPVEPTERDGAALLRLVQLTDGLPLALELAGARLAVLGFAQLVAGLERATNELLRDPVRTGRHASMDAAVHWSWSLLTPPERTALARCAVFAGSFDLGAAQEVLEPGASSADDLLQVLVGCSLVRSREGLDGSRRFQLWESVRAFAVGRLEDLDEIYGRMARWYAVRAEAFNRQAHGAAFVTVLAEADQDLPNYLAVAERAGPEAARVCNGAYRLLVRRLDRSRQVELFLRAAAHTPVTDLQIRLRVVACGNLTFSDFPRAIAVGREAQALANAHGTDDDHVAVALSLGVAEWYGGDAEAGERTFLAAVPHCRVGGGALHEFRLQTNLAELALERGEYAVAVQRCADGLAALRSVSDPTMRSWPHLRAGGLLTRLRQPDAVEVVERSLAEMGPTGLTVDRGVAWYYLAAARWMDGDAAGVEAAWVEVDRHPTDLPSYDAVALALRAVSRFGRAPDRARRDLDLARTALERCGVNQIDVVTQPLADAMLALFGDPRPLRSWLERTAPSPRFAFLRGALALVDGLLAGTVSAERGREAAAALGAIPLLEAAMTGAVVGFAAERAAEAERTWSIAADASWFQPPDGERVSLEHRPVLVALLAALVDAPRPLSMAELFRAGWPGQAVRPDSMHNRVRVAVSTLRKLGLPHVKFEGGGYRLDRTTPFRVAQAAKQ